MTETNLPPHAGVRVPPPFLFVAGFVIAWLLQRAVPVPVLRDIAPRAVGVVLGWLLIALGLGLNVWALNTFQRAHTTVIPRRPATRVVTTGPYRFSRNPMYIGFALVYLGLAFWLDWGWLIMTLPLVLIVLYVLVIRREERYLGAAFSEEYGAYRRRVRRWLGPADAGAPSPRS
jgi:protein-S-isoprenylcysteine O-methyltransferase Ste14